jgi:hypothetical protein
MKKDFSVIIVVSLIISGFSVVGANIKTNDITFKNPSHDGNLVFTLYFPTINEGSD